MCFDIPVISVGNLSVGGSGKTPMVEFLIRNLSIDYNIVVLSRGYGRRTKGFLWVEKDVDPTQTGDEPLQVKTKFPQIGFAVCENRVAGINRIIQEKPETNLILLDDAFQHRAVRPKIQLLLSNYSKPFFTDWILPVGRLRESRRGASRADAVIFTKCPEKIVAKSWSKKPVFYSQINYQRLEITQPIIGFSGLADNTLFVDFLRNNYKLRTFRAFSDHYAYKQQNLDKILKDAAGATILCTEKDWIKIKHLQGSDKVKAIPIYNTIIDEQHFLNWITAKLNES